MKREGMTSVVVTHNLELAQLMSRRITLEEGRAVEKDYMLKQAILLGNRVASDPAAAWRG
jgi:ABC-type lipoprotein export system ATPase subunit